MSLQKDFPRGNHKSARFPACRDGCRRIRWPQGGGRGCMFSWLRKRARCWRTWAALAVLGLVAAGVSLYVWAAGQLERVRRGDPETPHILEAGALGCLDTYRLPEALAFLERWLALAPADAQALYLRGLVREGMGDTDHAGADYREAVGHDPDH